MKFNLVKISSSKIVIFITLSILLVFFLKAGTFLKLEISNSVADNILIFYLVGSFKDRALATAELSKKTGYPNIAYGKTKDTDYRFLDSLGIGICRDTDKIKMSLMALGIPENKIIPLEAQTKSTMDEAILLKAYLEKHPEIKKVTLVTSSYHTRRAYWIVKNRLSQLDREISIDVYPSPYTATNLNQWWRKKEDAAVVATEYMKLLSFCLWERWN